MVERLHSEQYIINKVFDPSNNTLRVESETAIVLSGVTLNVSGQVNQGAKGAEPWAVSGTVVVSNTITTNATILNQPTVNQGSSPWIVSGIIVLSNPTTVVQANQGTRGPDAWPVSGSVVVSNTVTTNAAITNIPTVVQGNSIGAPWIISGTVALSAGAIDIGKVDQGLHGGDPWAVSGIVVIGGASNFTPLTSGTTSGQGLSAATNLILMGFSSIETAGATAQFILNHGTSNAGPIISWVSLSANQSTREWYGPQGKNVPNGVYVQKVSGSTQITLDNKIGV